MPMPTPGSSANGTGGAKRRTCNSDDHPVLTFFEGLTQQPPQVAGDAVKLVKPLSQSIRVRCTFSSEVSLVQGVLNPVCFRRSVGR